MSRGRGKATMGARDGTEQESGERCARELIGGGGGGGSGSGGNGNGSGEPPGPGGRSPPLGDVCDYCGTAALRPHDERQRRRHVRRCIRRHRGDMEFSFAVAASRDKNCSICFENVLEKDGEHKFGVLSHCNHCFCLGCIRQWRKSTDFDKKVRLSCPQCRVRSKFVCPSFYWPDTPEDKARLIASYLSALSTKHCKYFRRGAGRCPFAARCFYLHALPDAFDPPDPLDPPDPPSPHAALVDLLLSNPFLYWALLAHHFPSN